MRTYLVSLRHIRDCCGWYRGCDPVCACSARCLHCGRRICAHYLGQQQRTSTGIAIRSLSSLALEVNISMGEKPWAQHKTTTYPWYYLVLKPANVAASNRLKTFLRTFSLEHIIELRRQHTLDLRLGFETNALTQVPALVATSCKNDGFCGKTVCSSSSLDTITLIAT